MFLSLLTLLTYATGHELPTNQPPPDPIRVDLTIEEPMSYPCALHERTLSRSRRCLYPGSDNQQLGLILDLCHMPYTLVDVVGGGTWLGANSNSSEGGSSTNSSVISWSTGGPLGRLLDGRVDVLNVKYALTEGRLDSYTYGHFASQIKTMFAVRRPDFTTWQIASRLFTVFSPGLYTAFVIYASVTLLVLTVCDRYVLGKATGSLERLSMGKGLPEATSAGRNGRGSRRLTLVLLAALQVFSFGLYQNVLLVEMFDRNAPQELTVESLVQDLSTGARTLLTQSANGFFSESVLTSNTTLFRSLREAVRDNPIRVERNLTRALDLVAGDAKYILRTSSRKGPYQIRNRCELQLLELDVGPYWNSFMMSKHGRLTHNDRHRFKQCHASVAGYKAPEPPLDADCVQRSKGNAGSQFDTRPLALTSLLGVFALLLGGSVFGVLVLGVEVALGPAAVTGKTADVSIHWACRPENTMQDIAMGVSVLRGKTKVHGLSNSKWGKIRYRGRSVRKLTVPCATCGTTAVVS